MGCRAYTARHSPPCIPFTVTDVSVNFSAIFDTHTCYYVQRQAEGGRAEGILQVATQMKRLGIPVKQICQATGLSEEKVAASIFR